MHFSWLVHVVTNHGDSPMFFLGIFLVDWSELGLVEVAWLLRVSLLTLCEFGHHT